MLKKLFILACFLALAMIPASTTAQNIIGARWPSDAGPAVFGYGTATDTTAQTMVADPGNGVAVYVYSAACYSTSATAAVALIKASSTTFAAVPCVPSAGLSQPVIFTPPLKLTASEAATMTASTSITTAYFYLSGRTYRSN